MSQTKSKVELTDQEQATILAALRHWQDVLHGGHSWAELNDYMEIATNLWEFQALSFEEIDALAEKMGGMPVDAIE